MLNLVYWKESNTQKKHIYWFWDLLQDSGGGKEQSWGGPRSHENAMSWWQWQLAMESGGCFPFIRWRELVDSPEGRRGTIRCFRHPSRSWNPPIKPHTTLRGGSAQSHLRVEDMEKTTVTYSASYNRWYRVRIPTQITLNQNLWSLHCARLSSWRKDME